MDYSIISRVEKGKVYAEERATRIDFQTFTAKLMGDNNEHFVSYDEGQWQCDCGYFNTHRHCAHTTAMERVLADMVEIAS